MKKQKEILIPICFPNGEPNIKGLNELFNLINKPKKSVVMKIKDLIKKLQELDPDFEVIAFCEPAGEYYPVMGIVKGKLNKNNYNFKSKAFGDRVPDNKINAIIFTDGWTEDKYMAEGQ